MCVPKRQDVTKGSDVKAKMPVIFSIAVGGTNELFHTLPANIKHKKNKRKATTIKMLAEIEDPY